jgi:hypothetical protein
MGRRAEGSKALRRIDNKQIGFDSDEEAVGIKGEYYGRGEENL